jgi:hypothetical protein
MDVRKCSKCLATKPLTEFHQRPGGKPRGRQCKVCVNRANVAREAAQPEKATARVVAWREANPDKHSDQTKRRRKLKPELFRRNNVWTNFRVEFYEEWDRQQGLCASCTLPMRKDGREHDSVCVDHNRKCCNSPRSCGKCFRGLIHRNCNLALGYAQDNPAILLAAVDYIERWRAQGPRSDLPGHRTAEYRRAYKINFDEEWDRQAGLCLCCFLPMKLGGVDSDSVCIDHDRSCCNRQGSCGHCFRGLVHRNCNLVLGYSRENVHTLNSAVQYLESFSSRPFHNPVNP